MAKQKAKRLKRFSVAWMKETAMQTIVQMKKQTERGLIDPLFVAIYPDGTRKAFPLPPGGEQLMNSGEAKEQIFGWLRRHTAEFHVACWIFGTFAWMGQPTEKGKALTREQFEAIPFHDLEKLGYTKLFESITVTVQSETEVILGRQLFVKDPGGDKPRWCGQPEFEHLPQLSFGGRQKMFGATRADEIGYDPRRMREEGLNNFTKKKVQ